MTSRKRTHHGVILSHSFGGDERIPLGPQLLQLPSGQFIHHVLGTAGRCRARARGGFGRAEPIEGAAGAAVVQATWRKVQLE